MFTPPYCPNLTCQAHDPDFELPGRGAFYVRRGFYHPKCRTHPVPRFRCKSCGTGFSRQTFRYDCHDHKPHLNEQLLEMMREGQGIRQSGRSLCLSRRCTQLKVRKIARHLQRLHGEGRELTPWIPW